MKSTKIMIIAALAAGALLAGSSSLLAQDSTNTPPAGQHGHGMKGGRPDFAKELNLTDDQKPKFQEIMKGEMDKRKALRDDTTLTSEDKRTKMKAIQDDTNTQLKTLLTADQYAKWEEMSKKMHGNRPPGGDKPPQN